MHTTRQRMGVRGTALAGILLTLVVVLPFEARADVRSNARVVDQVISEIPLAELLGPLAPVALSPFFGLACLSGISLLVEAGLLPANSFLTAASPTLARPEIFGLFLVLSVLTALPKLTKVSKPVAQILDEVEAYAGFISLIIIQWAARRAAAEGVAPPETVMAGFGFGGVLAAFAFLNLFVIHTVKVFVECLIFLSPFPLVDAGLEAVNKVVCASLMLLYALHPGIAAAVNLGILFLCLLVFRKALRWSRFFRAVVVDPLWASLTRRNPDPTQPVKAFLQTQWNRWPRRTRVWLRRGESGWDAEVRGWRHRTAHLPETLWHGEVRQGLLTHRIEFTAADGARLVLLLSRAYSPVLPGLERILRLAEALDPEEGLATASSNPTATVVP